MSAPSSASMTLSVSSSAAWRPISGFAPAPSPLVSFAPICSLTGAFDCPSAWTSVFATRKSMPSRPASIIRFTAFDPPPPTPMTLIDAPKRLASSNRNLMEVSTGKPAVTRSSSQKASEFRHEFLESRVRILMKIVCFSSSVAV